MGGGIVPEHKYGTQTAAYGGPRACPPGNFVFKLGGSEMNSRGFWGAFADSK